jgi:hypothetical protein
VHQNDIFALLARVAGLGALAADTTFQSAITSLAGPYAVKILGAMSLLSILAADIIRIQSVPTPPSQGSTK